MSALDERPTGVALLASYFFGSEPVHLNDIRWRTTTGDRVDESWTYPDITGPRYTKPVWLLTSAHTFSAGEEFAYDLQVLHKASG